MKYPATILITGGTGLIGTAVIRHALARGSVVYCTTRRAPRTIEAHSNIRYVQWDGIGSLADLPPQIDAVVNLSGENIGAQRWSDTQKKRILDSRVISTERLIESLGRLKSPPKIFLSASAIGFYGDRNDERLVEESPPGKSFLSSVTQQWESAAQGASQWDATVTLLRFGVVLSKDGGALKKMLPLFRFGLGGRLGTGAQYMSWISLTDVARAIDFLYENPLPGAVNLTAPKPCRNRDFTTILAATVHRPALFPLPRSIIELFLGQMGKELLLFSAHVSPSRLIESGFTFSDQEIKEFLPQELKYTAHE